MTQQNETGRGTPAAGLKSLRLAQLVLMSTSLVSGRNRKPTIRLMTATPIGYQLAVGRRHPVVRFDPLLGIDPRLELGGTRGVLKGAILAFRNIERLRVHSRLPLAIQYITQISMKNTFL